ncbi:hypothetical protein [Roseivirga sp. UBA1976]|uniref:hypothetical protein n=1 Tax=Roseivirga sp. UBA1976 TaxID=1947386 RepID=UPI002580B2DB|nr:hypothetical protein [Roseivirga sp. UBA1976]MEC7755449.1 hypothetical protein [Bacteroidota bacterium]|tara:strand:+ start:542 stop:1228 length:687 start_codon:yes stop_codon:yes gene_type:complete
MITKDEQHTIEQYLKSVDINTMEFFEEMYDHICTSYENRTDKTQDIKTHIRDVVQPSFGGVNGIIKIRDQRTKARIRLVRKRFGQIFISYFLGWPNVLITLGVILGSWTLSQLFGIKTLITVSTICFIFIPLTFFFGKWIQFWRKCKKAGKVYRTSEVYQIFTPFMALALQVPNMTIQSWNMFADKDIYGSLFIHPEICIPLSIIMLISFFTLSKLYKEEFTIKTSFN